MTIQAQVTKDITIACQHLQAGHLVAFPTETVYGLGADARNPEAIKKVFQAKGRPADHPLIVHICSVAEVEHWAINIPDSAWLLAEHFWPGPLTLILTKAPQVSPLITGNQTTIAIRVPDHKLTLELLQQFGSGLVGPSANNYGHVSPTTAAHVAADLGNKVAAILDGGACTVGIESTIVSLVSEQPVIMRQGAITAEQIATVLNIPVKINAEAKPEIRSSGSHESHYAPYTASYLINTTELFATVRKTLALNKKLSVISFQAKPSDLPESIYWQQLDKNPVSYSHDLYSNLREHDQLHNDAILIEEAPNEPAWAAIIDRLSRASFK